MDDEDLNFDGSNEFNDNFDDDSIAGGGGSKPSAGGSAGGGGGGGSGSSGVNTKTKPLTTPTTQLSTTIEAADAERRQPSAPTLPASAPASTASGSVLAATTAAPATIKVDVSVRYRNLPPIPTSTSAATSASTASAAAASTEAEPILALFERDHSGDEFAFLAQVCFGCGLTHSSNHNTN